VEVDSDTYIVVDVDVSGWSTNETLWERNRWSDDFDRAGPG
jgi:hypothetical protein